ncbi:DUF5018 domain-containing protein [Aquimarina aquimarini]|uniref:DUF5018 domain-containing protein n=1 Tax=Aquimarina aquimarini TaxID=1191734 RepID=UPI000D55F34B|nr:DUF5018 domain-containing protein [Aquimarina aquimarini]
MSIKKIVLAIFPLFLLFSCSEDDSDTSNPTNKIPKIVSFEFMKSDNSSLSADVSATINHTEKTISVIFPPNTALESLIPSISVSEGVDITPNNMVEQDFREPSIYILSGEGFEKTEYTITTFVTGSDKAAIQKLSFLTSNNPHLVENITTVIEGSVIKAQISEAIDLSALIPSIEIFEGASISPDNNTPMDFTEDVKYIVTAQDATTKSEYTVQITSLSSTKEITKFQFSIDSQIYDANIDHNTFEVSLALPYNTDLTNLVPIVEIGSAISITPSSSVAQNFNEVVIYTITAEDGSTQEYKAIITTMTASQNDRAVLEELYNLNKDYNSLFTYLNWDLDADNMDSWEGVTLSGTRVTELIISSTINIYKLPESIGKLSELNGLTIVGSKLNTLPTQIGDLEKLEILTITNNKNLTSIPAEIGKLKSLNSLILYDNNLNELPVEIRQMTSVFRIDVKNNNLNSLPVEIANIPNLLVLNVSGNPLIVIPQVICDMKTETTNVSILITKDEEDVCS